MFTTIATKRIMTALSISVLSFGAIGAIAQTPRAGELNLLAQRMPDTISQIAKRKLTRDAATRERSEDAAEDATENATLKQIAAILAPERRLLKSALEKEAWFAAMNRESDRIGKSRGMTDQQRSAALVAMEAKYRPQYQRTVKLSGLNIAAMQAKLTRISPDLRLTERFTVIRQAAGIGPGSKTDEGFRPPVRPPAVSEQGFTPPFSIDDNSISEHGLTLDRSSEALADANTGRCRVNLKINDGAGGWSRGRASVGQFITVPAGVRRIEVTATIDRSYSLTAQSVFAVSGANARGFLSVSGAGFKPVRQMKEFGSVIAPLFWVGFEGDRVKPVDFSVATDIPPQGTTVLVRFRLTGLVYTAGWTASATNRTTGVCRSIRVRMLR